MIHIAKINEKDRNALFVNTAAKMGMTVAIIEKDFWVCFILDYLFHRCQWKNHIAFKGGTSLSKAYGLIERFSEDIDLILDWRLLGYDINEPWEERSNTKQDLFNKQANKNTASFLEESFLPAIVADLQKESAAPIHCHIDEADPQTVVIAYQHGFQDISILPVIRLEVGALAAWTPTTEKAITPYVATHYPNLFKQSSTDVLTVLPERTFWEKVTILHREANRPDNKDFPVRYSRHYYDLYRMVNSSVKTTALADLELLNHVVKFKEKFYRCPWAKYENAKVGTMMLTPPKRNIAALEDDYGHMQNMLFGNKPTFEEILDGIDSLEKEINSISL